MVLYAKEYDVFPGKDVSEPLYQLLLLLARQNEPTVLILEPGIYHLSAVKCPNVTMYISNASVGDSAMYPDEEGDCLHTVPVGWYLKDVTDTEIRGKGAHFVMHGKMTHMFFHHCRNVSVQGITFSVDHPDFHLFTVTSVTSEFVDFELHSSEHFRQIDQTYYFVSENDQVPTAPMFPPQKGWDCAHCYDCERENHYVRTIHPFRDALRFQRISDHTFRASYHSTQMFQEGQCYGLYHCGRRYNGIVMDQCCAITLCDLTQHFNYGLGVVAQDTEQISITHCTFAPEHHSIIKTASCADFIQISMCKGNIEITDNDFCGAGDDVLNVHGIHFLIDQVKDDQLYLSFPHFETYGFCPLHVGDNVEYVDRQTLLSNGTGVIRAVEMIDEKHLLLQMDQTKGAAVGCAFEDITMCPNLYFARNTMSRIVTRGLLITTRGKVVVEDNDFLDLTMDAILVSDDATKWYESGPVYDLLIRNNRFDCCGEYYLEVCPENGTHTIPVHRNIRLESNHFTQPRGIYVKCVDGFLMRDNLHPMPISDVLTLKHVKNAVIE